MGRSPGALLLAVLAAGALAVRLRRRSAAVAASRD